MATDLSNLFNNYIQTYDFDTNKAYPIVGVGSICTADIGLGDPEDSTEQRIKHFEEYISTITPTNIPDASHADSADKLGANNMGAENIFIYLKDGTPIACSSTIGNTTTPVYINAGKIEACSEIPSGYKLPTATDSILGGIKVGYTTKDKNYKVQLDGNGNAYVNVPGGEVSYKTGSVNLEMGKSVRLGTLTIDGSEYYIDASMPVIETDGGTTIIDAEVKNLSNVLAWDTSVAIAKVNDVSIYAKLPSNPDTNSDKKWQTESSTSTVYLAGKTTKSTDTGTGYVNASVYMQNGDIYANDFAATSDERLKTFKDDISIDFNKIKEIPKKYFTFNDDPDKVKIGTSAQELQKVYPELVTYNNDDDLYHVNYANLSIVALAAIDKLYAEIVELKSKIKELENVKC